MERDETSIYVVLWSLEDKVAQIKCLKTASQSRTRSKVAPTKINRSVSDSCPKPVSIIDAFNVN